MKILNNQNRAAAEKDVNARLFGNEMTLKARKLNNYLVSLKEEYIFHHDILCYEYIILCSQCNLYFYRSKTKRM